MLQAGPHLPGHSCCLGAVIACPAVAPLLCSGQESRSAVMAHLPLTLSLLLQASGAVPSAVAWAIASPTAPSWRRCRPSKSATLAARTTWLTALWTSSLGSTLPSAPLCRPWLPLSLSAPAAPLPFLSPGACPALLWLLFQIVGQLSLTKLLPPEERWSCAATAHDIIVGLSQPYLSNVGQAGSGA